jgi:hypothetical protein
LSISCWWVIKNSGMWNSQCKQNRQQATHLV